MTPLEKARQGEQSKEECATCGNCVKIRNVSYCEISGKVLLDCFMQIGRCMHNPSDYKKNVLSD